MWSCDWRIVHPVSKIISPIKGESSADCFHSIGLIMARVRNAVWTPSHPNQASSVILFIINTFISVWGASARLRYCCCCFCLRVWEYIRKKYNLWNVQMKGNLSDKSRIESESRIYDFVLIKWIFMKISALAIWRFMINFNFFRRFLLE